MIDELQIKQDFDTIFKITSSEGFLKMEALNGEIPFWIAPYEVKLHNEYEKQIENLRKKLKTNSIQALVIDLFQLASEIIFEDFTVEQIEKLEKRKSKEQFKRALQATLNIHDIFIPKIKECLESNDYNLLILKNVGSLYPFMRSHTILNNLQSAIKTKPVLMFYPGAYTGQSLNLFGELIDDNYYRANNILKHKKFIHE
ncbi:DUF1788 domain-containing protein [Empedobacter falsenii]|uniref:DUF1788 domain-containing protein n=1 Tax=Empedobacter falsenii TaxID=343874 RepID=UPI003A80FFEA